MEHPSGVRSAEPKVERPTGVRSGESRPSNYKTVLCHHYASSAGCRYGEECFYAHGEADRRSLSGPKDRNKDRNQSSEGRSPIDGSSGPTRKNPIGRTGSGSASRAAEAESGLALRGVDALRVAKESGEGREQLSAKFLATASLTLNHDDLRASGELSSGSNANRIDITGIDKKELLRVMWDNQKYADAVRMIGTRALDQFDNDEADAAIKKGAIGYYNNKAIKTDLSGDFIDLEKSMYDRVHGVEGTLKNIVRNLRAGVVVKPKTRRLKCPDSDTLFDPMGDPILENPESVQCSNCTYFRGQHKIL